MFQNCIVTSTIVNIHRNASKILQTTTTRASVKNTLTGHDASFVSVNQSIMHSMLLYEKKSAPIFPTPPLFNPKFENVPFALDR